MFQGILAMGAKSTDDPDGVSHGFGHRRLENRVPVVRLESAEKPDIKTFSRRAASSPRHLFRRHETFLMSMEQQSKVRKSCMFKRTITAVKIIISRAAGRRT
jgi:hypothetical protein